MQRSKRVRFTSAVGAVVAIALALASCSTEKPSDDTAAADAYDCANPNADTTTNVSLTIPTFLSAGAIWLGIEKGFFAENGLTVDVETVSTVPASIQAVQGRATEFGFSGTIPLLQALQGGVPVQIIAPYAGIAPNFYEKMQAGEEGFTTEVSALVTRKDSGLNSPGDLDGKTVAVTDVKSQSEVTARYVIDHDGGDSASVNFIMMSPADGYNAVVAGQVDAAQSIVPIVLNAEADGVQIISWTGVEALHEGPTSVLITTNDFAQANPETVARFNCAVRLATAYATDHTDEVRAAYAEKQDIDVATLATAVVPYFYTTVDIEGIERYQDLLLDYGFLDAPIDISAVVNPVTQ